MLTPEQEQLLESFKSSYNTFVMMIETNSPVRHFRVILAGCDLLLKMIREDFPADHPHKKYLDNAEKHIKNVMGDIGKDPMFRVVK
jgi:hypothetical protein